MESGSVRKIVETNQFRRDFKKVAKAHPNWLLTFEEVIHLLVRDAPLPFKNRDHALTGEWKTCRECHLRPDWLLIYQKVDAQLVLLRTGSHSELFG